LINDDEIVKLFYQNYRKYNCYGNNWGKSKGLNNYNDVCVILNKGALEKFKCSELSKLPPQTKNKLYVACSRTRRNLYFIDEVHLKQWKN
jgi:hypothetical protein